MNAEQHGTEEQIERYTRRLLPAAELATFEEHLLICDGCRERIETEVVFRSALQVALQEDAPVVDPLPDSSRIRAAVNSPSVHPGTGGVDWLGWLRKPAWSMALAFALLLAGLAVFSGNRNTLPAVAALRLTATRGETTSINRARELDLTLNGAPPDGGPFRVELVNAQGQNVWGSLADSEGDAVVVRVLARLQAGDYFVRLYAADGPLLHEYGFRIRD